MSLLCIMLLTVELISCHPQENIATTGYASHYADGVMSDVIDVRRGFGQFLYPIDHYDGYVATMDCGLVGSEVYARPVSSKDWESFLVVDCAVRDDSDGTRTWMEINNILIEVDYDTAVRWDSVGGGIGVDVIGLNRSYDD